MNAGCLQSKRDAQLQPVKPDVQREAIRRDLLGPPIIAQMARMAPAIGKPLMRHSPRLLTTMPRAPEEKVGVFFCCSYISLTAHVFSAAEKDIFVVAASY